MINLQQPTYPQIVFLQTPEALQSNRRKLHLLKPKLSDFLLDLHRSLAHQGFAKILDRATGMPAVFANPYASRSRHNALQKIAQLR